MYDNIFDVGSTVEWFYTGVYMVCVLVCCVETETESQTEILITDAGFLTILGACTAFAGTAGVTSATSSRSTMRCVQFAFSSNVFMG